jgi:hypothetical protein
MFAIALRGSLTMLIYFKFEFTKKKVFKLFKQGFNESIKIPLTLRSQN